MSYKLVPYLINLKALRSILSNRDVEVVEEIRTHLSSPANAGDALSLIDAVDEIVRGEIAHPNSGYQYGYALQVLCEHLGVRLDVTNWKNVHWATLEDIGLNAIIGKGCPITLPPIPDFPTIGHLPLRDVQRLANRSLKNPKSSSDPKLQLLIQEYESWLVQAYQAERDIVFFYY